jgi:Putative Flp pilus-assembly TadE/G-like
VSLLLVSILLVVVLGVAALGIDLASLYVARDDAQRTADAAALAGAKVFADTGCVTSSSCTSFQSRAQQSAIDVAGENRVAGEETVVQPSDISFSGLSTTNPRITVTVQRSTARSNPVPLFFAKIFGSTSMSISASATAEAYSPSGSGPGLCVSCVKPLALPDCDPNHAAPSNSICNGQAYFVDTGSGQIVNPGAYPTGVIGMSWTAHSKTSPSQYGLIDVGGGSSQLGGNITSCNPTPYTCQSILPTLSGKKVGPINSSINSLINAGSNGPANGQDTIDTSSGPPYPIRAGANNPLVQSGAIAVGTAITTSTSIQTFGLYNPASAGGGTVTFVGFMQVFIVDVQHNGKDDPVDFVILNVSGCGSSAPNCSSSGGGVGGGGGSLIPIRLVRSP